MRNVVILNPEQWDEGSQLQTTRGLQIWASVRCFSLPRLCTLCPAPNRFSAGLCKSPILSTSVHRFSQVWITNFV